MGFMIAFKAFFKAFKNPEKAKLFLEEKQVDQNDKLSSEESSHLHLLALLQKDGRLIDFLKEDISQYNDAQIGAAIRQIHRECAKSIEEFVTLRPLFQEPEGASVTVVQGYDPSAIKVVGHVRGNPPYQGILRHKGWRAHKLSLPKQISRGDLAIVCPAEIEVQG